MLTYNRNDNKIVLCHEFTNDAEAHIAEAALRNEGIEAIIDNEIFSRIYPIGFNTIGGTRLMVRRRDLDRATEIIDSLNFSGL